jgi:hypothetical protein
MLQSRLYTVNGPVNLFDIEMSHGIPASVQ